MNHFETLKKISLFPALPSSASYNPFLSRLSDQAQGPFLIKPAFEASQDEDLDFLSFLAFIEQGIRKILPASMLKEMKQELGTTSQRRKCLQLLDEQLPLIVWSIPIQAPCRIHIALLCASDFTQGIERYVSETFSRCLIPSQYLNVSSAQSLNFQFIAFPKKNYFFNQTQLMIEDEKDLSLAAHHFPRLVQELKLNILAVKRARNIISSPSSSGEKTYLIQQDMDFSSSSKSAVSSPFSHMHHLFIKFSSEEKVTQLKKSFSSILKNRLKTFDHNIFNEIQNFVPLFGDTFTASRNLHHLIRLISYKYLFRKILQSETQRSPNERHLFLRILKTEIHGAQKRHVAGILIGLNVLSDNELFEEKHIVEALRRSLPSLKKVDNSYIEDRRNNDRIRLFYLEVEKEDHASLTLSETKHLRKSLPRELKVENIIYPVFMPRNEEEMIRKVLSLSQQLKYVKDIPQVMISFDTQTEQDLSFTIILLRLLKQDGPSSLTDLFRRADSFMHSCDVEIKQVGLVRKRYPKEANIFKVNLNKKLFLRRDYSLDLFKARQTIYNELVRVLGPIRDFNGGILSKQQEVFLALKNSLKDLNQNQDFILENFFYSITPTLMQSLLQPDHLKTLFLMFLDTLDRDFKQQKLVFQTKIQDGYVFVSIGSTLPLFGEKALSIIHQFPEAESDLCYTFSNVYEISHLGCLYRCEDQQKAQAFIKKIRQKLHYLGLVARDRIAKIGCDDL